LIIAFQLRYPHIDLAAVAERVIGVKALDGMDGLNTLISGNPIPQNKSHPEVFNSFDPSGNIPNEAGKNTCLSKESIFPKFIRKISWKDIIPISLD
jgi:hypothetical protein